ncbi:DUF6220 domain-containing protein [Micromonospora sp. SL1-18]|uniref:DUF6220 domain-containing protein n=1 Tax=Micromonospora sp. SL1-18 TaxID=3399128 RepID=UPI003A4E2E52
MAVLGLLFLAILFQFYLAGVGAFDKPHTDDSFALHRINGMAVVTGLSVVATIVAAVARLGIRTVVMTIVPGLLVVVQMLIRAIAEAFNASNGDTSGASVAIFGLHVINGMLIMLVTVTLIRRMRKLLAGSSASAPQPAEAAPVSESA